MWNELKIEFAEYWKVRAVRMMFWVRFLGYFAIYISPFWGMVLAIYLDTWDWDYLQKYKVSKLWYHRIDKVVDYIEYLMIIPLVIGTPIAAYYLLFLAWRTVGMILYFYFEVNPKLFVLYPNMSEYIALIYFFAQTFNLSWDITKWQWIVGLLIFKIIIELELHVFKFGLPVSTDEAKLPKWAQAYAKFNQNLIK